MRCTLAWSTGGRDNQAMVDARKTWRPVRGGGVEWRRDGFVLGLDSCCSFKSIALISELADGGCNARPMPAFQGVGCWAVGFRPPKGVARQDWIDNQARLQVSVDPVDRSSGASESLIDFFRPLTCLLLCFLVSCVSLVRRRLVFMIIHRVL